MFYSRKIITLIIAIFGILNASQALAGKTIYPGSMCVKWTASDPTPRLSSSRIFNDSTSRWMRVDCPVLHQHFGGVFQNDDMDDSDIGIIDANTSANARCWSVSKDQVGSSVYTRGSGGARSSTGFGNHEQNLDFARTNHNGASWAYIGCTIPPRQNGQSSGITYYSGQE